MNDQIVHLINLTGLVFLVAAVGAALAGYLLHLWL